MMINKFKLFFKFIFDSIKVLLFVSKNENSILFFGYEDSSSGAALLSLYMVKEISKQRNVVFVTVGKDDLDKEYKKCADLILRTPNKRIYSILKNKGIHNAILNALPACFDADVLKDRGYHIITLIHELHYLIDEFNMGSYVEKSKKYSNVIIFPSNFCRESFEKHYGKIGCKTIIKPQGLFLTEKCESNKEQNARYIREQNGIPLNNKIVLSVGIGDYRKGLDLFFDLANMEKDLSVTYLHIGKIKSALINLYLNQNKQIPSNFKNIDFISNPVELFKYYDGANVLVMTSREEPFGSAVLEAFSASTPVVGFKDAGGFNDIVIENKSGFLSKYLDLECMSFDVHKAIDDCDIQTKLGVNGKEIVSKMTFNDYIALLMQELSL